MEIEIIGFDKKEDNGLPICPNCHEKTLSFPIAVEDEEEGKGILGKIFSREVTYTEYHCQKCGCIWRIK